MSKVTGPKSKVEAEQSMPAFDPATAQRVEPRRHEPTARTVGHEQPGEGGAMHLFTIGGQFIATEPAPGAAESKI